MFLVFKGSAFGSRCSYMNLVHKILCTYLTSVENIDLDTLQTSQKQGTEHGMFKKLNGIK